MRLCKRGQHAPSRVYSMKRWDGEKERHWPVPWAGTGSIPPLAILLRSQEPRDELRSVEKTARTIRSQSPGLHPLLHGKAVPAHP